MQAVKVMVAVAIAFITNARGRKVRPAKGTTMTNKFISPLLALLVFFTTTSSAETDVIETMNEELQRAFDALQQEEVPPYYISYEITGDESVNVSGSFGSVHTQNTLSQAVLDIDMRVGSYELDNTREVRGAGGGGFRFMGSTPIPVDDAEALRTALWFHTESKYRGAIERLSRVKAALKDQVEKEDKSDDFSSAPVAVSIDEYQPLQSDADAWADKIRRYTKPFAQSENIIRNRATISGNTERRWFVNSEGTKTLLVSTFYQLSISASSKADDGMILPLYSTYHARTLDALPSDEEILRDVAEMIDNLEKLREAPLVDPYTGPAILSGRATGVFFHEILGHRLEGHRQKSEDEGQTFKKKLGEPLLPETFTVVFDPHMKKYGDEDLIGHYTYDNEGVKGQRVVVIENGILKGFLMSREPIAGFPASNGHGRKNYGRAVVARQSNMIVEIDNPYTPEELKELLLERVKEEGKEFGLYFDNIQGGFTYTGRGMPNSFNVDPVLVYKIYADGREEMVRGVDLIGTPLTSFSHIEAGADDMAIFNGICGAESGSVPVSAIAPSILVGQIEVQKASSSRNIPPILPSPVRRPDPQSINYEFGAAR